MYPSTGRNRQKEEGHATYKAYAYSPIGESTTSAVTTLAIGTEPRESEERETKCILPGKLDFRDEMTEKGSKLLQFVAAAAANLIIVATGAAVGWTSPILPKLQAVPVDPDNPLGVSITTEQSSWIGSLIALGAVFGGFISGYLAETFGRKKSLLMSVAGFLLAWVLVATAANVAQIYAARLIFGFTMATSFTVVPMYVGEIAETSIRGVLGSFLQLFITVGFLYSYCIGPYVSYMALWIACAALPILFYAVFMFMPESPYYLLSRGQKDEAIEALAKLRGKTASGVQKEIDEMQAVIHEAFRTETTMMDLINSKANFKALLYTSALVAFQQTTGINVVLFYTESIFRSTGSSINPSVQTIIIGIVQVASSAVTPLIVDRLGRRILLLASGIGTTVTITALGLFFYLKDHEQQDVEGISWLPVVSLVVFMILYCIGWGPLPWAVMGEMLATNVKSKVSSITVCTCWLLAFIITKFFDNISQAFGTYTAFWIFGVCCILNILFTVFILPETKGKSLQQIQDELNGIVSPMPELQGTSSSMKKF